MSFARICSAQVDVLTGKLVSVEVDISRGLNAFTIVGLGDRAVDEARDRVGSALKNAGFESPKSKNQKTVVSLSPADLKKEGSQFDLPIALGFLLAEGIPLEGTERAAFVGELGLDGSVRAVRGVLPIALAAQAAGLATLYVPEANADEAALVEGVAVYAVPSLKALIDHLSPDIDIAERAEPKRLVPHARDRTTLARDTGSESDFGDIVGQESVKRGLVIAAAGGHNVLMYGPPGTGKTMLARALAGILPRLSREAAIEVAAIHSAAGSMRREGALPEPPFRSPHHTSSYVSVIGGGAYPKPGEATLAHRGVLFLDEFPEFDRRVIESLRQPLEEREITIARAKGTTVFPAQFLFVAAMNPCPCGYKGSKVRTCSCTAADLVRYRRKLSGPLLDRIDIALYVGEIAHDRLGRGGSSERLSEKIRDGIAAARERAHVRQRAQGGTGKQNGELRAREVPLFAGLSPAAEATLNDCAGRLGLSARAYHRTQKLARTIADLAASEDVLPEHVLEAVRYRPQADDIA